MDNPNIYPPVKQCIYCYATNPDGARLGDEHIVPQGLAGLLVLKEASCRRCEAIINTFETRVLRSTFEDARRHLKIRSKKKGRTRPQTATLGFPSLENGGFEWREVDLAEHPFIFLLPIFVPPGLLTGQVGRPGEFLTIGTGAHITPDALKRLQADRAATFTRFVPSDIARFVAKVAHSYAVAEHGLAGFQPMLLDVILGRENNIGRYIGSGEAPTPHHVGYHQLGIMKERGLLIVSVKFFGALAHMPTYRAVVGPAAVLARA